MRKNNQDVDWSIRDHRPMHLKILQAFSNIMGDRDRTLFPSLLEGVSTGNDIPPSGICPPNEDNQVDHTPLSIHSSNWTIWLHHLYKDLYSIPASLFSINLDNWPAVMNSIDEQLKFQHQPAHTGIPVGSTLVSIGHQSVTSLSDLHNLRLRDRISHSRPRIIPPKALRRFEASHQTLSRLDFRTSTYPEFASTAILARAGSSRCHGSWRK